jgi:isocitrate dehydrogenase
MKTPLAEIDGDEMTRVLWALVKEKLIAPFVDLKTEYYDLSIENRDKTADRITTDAANAVARLGVGVKCATITSNKARQEEYGLSALYPSPNATIRAILDGTVFRKPIQCGASKPAVASWVKPIAVGRHAYGDVYKAAEMAVPGPGTVELVYRPAKGGGEQRMTVMEMPGAGIVQGTHNLDASITQFARASFLYALGEKIDLWFAAKDTISKVYDGRFRDIFQEVWEGEFKEQFEHAGLHYFYTLIDDAVARVMRSEGGFLWACKNYDGDVLSDMIAAASGSLAMMTSALISPGGNGRKPCYEYEAAHGTVQKHYYRWKAGEKPSTNPTALIFAWTGALSKRGELDGIPELGVFAKQLESSVIDTIDAGCQTSDLARFTGRHAVDSRQFCDAAAAKLSEARGL